MTTLVSSLILFFNYSFFFLYMYKRKNLNEHKSFEFQMLIWSSTIHKLTVDVKDKIKTHKSPGLCFKLVFCLENDKLSWNLYWHKNSLDKCIHISALQSRMFKLRESTRVMLSSVLVFGVCECKHPHWLLSKTFLYTLRTF